MIDLRGRSEEANPFNCPSSDASWLTVLVVSDTGAPSADSNLLDNEITTRRSEASNSSASAAIRTTMYTVADE